MIGQLVSEIFMFESVDARTDNARTDTRMPARVPYYKLTLSLRLWWAKNNKSSQNRDTGLALIIIISSMGGATFFPVSI